MAEPQGGHINRAQLGALGVRPRQIEHWLRSGYLIHTYTDVYAVARRSENPIDQCHAALLAIGERAAMTGWSAGCLWGLDRTWSYPLEVTTPLRRSITGLLVHRNTRLLTSDITVQHGLKVTSPALTVLHVAPTLTDHQLERALDGRAGHDTPWAITRDREHDRRVFDALGIRTLRFCRSDLRDDPAATAATIQAELERVRQRRRLAAAQRRPG